MKYNFFKIPWWTVLYLIHDNVHKIRLSLKMNYLQGYKVYLKCKTQTFSTLGQHHDDVVSKTFGFYFFDIG